MDLQQTHELLIRASAIDNRMVPELTVIAWHDALDDIPYPDAIEALREHRRERPGIYLEPGHIRAGAKIIADRRARADRAAAGPQLDPTIGTPKPPEFDRVYLDELAAHRARRAERTGQPAITYITGDSLAREVEAALRNEGARRRTLARQELDQLSQENRG